ncbi:hypothetical protein AWB66_06363 [Caballeronia telluris]|uniref:Uncharacterized protein n=1 Tax=Caballeronia telluris TaxID=326475 RepID=A0A158KJ08_9BURK|nr:hypothetical protein AWB66_06363 [Caballeronia telluris]
MPDFFDPNQNAPVFTFGDAFASQAPQANQGILHGDPAEWWKAIPPSASGSVAAALPGIAAYQASTNPEAQANQGPAQGTQGDQGPQAAQALSHPQGAQGFQVAGATRPQMPQGFQGKVQDFMQTLANAYQGPQGLPSSMQPLQGFLGAAKAASPDKQQERQQQPQEAHPGGGHRNPQAEAWRRALMIIHGGE